MLEVGNKFRVVIEETNIYANGVVHLDGIVAFVMGGVKGDECVIEITRVYPHYAYAKISEILLPSPYRANKICKYFGKCGGCTLDSISTEHETEIKTEYVRGIFKKAGIDAEIEEIKTPVCKKYRNKIVVFYSEKGFGYMESGSNRVVPHTECRLSPDIFNSILAYANTALKSLSPRAIYLRRTNDGTEQIMIALLTYKQVDITEAASELVRHFPQIKSVYHSVASGKELVLEKQSFELIYGEKYITDELCGLKFRISPESFYQINRECAEQLYKKALSLANLNKSTVAADLFCGTGTIGIMGASQSGATVYGVEINENAVKDAKHNASLNNIKTVHFEAKDAKKFNKTVDTAIIDPPRKGCSDYMIETILRLKPKILVYISCNPETMVRDLKKLTPTYKISSPVSLYNMFPRTSHVESLVCLTRK